MELVMKEHAAPQPIHSRSLRRPSQRSITACGSWRFSDMHEEPFRKRAQPRQGGLRESCRGRWPSRAGASAASAAALPRREGGSPNRRRVPVNGKCTAWSA